MYQNRNSKIEFVDRVRKYHQQILDPNRVHHLFKCNNGHTFYIDESYNTFFNREKKKNRQAEDEKLKIEELNNQMKKLGTVENVYPYQDLEDIKNGEGKFFNDGLTNILFMICFYDECSSHQRDIRFLFNLHQLAGRTGAILPVTHCTLWKPDFTIYSSFMMVTFISFTMNYNLRLTKSGLYPI